jgi:hypothetical protein
LIQTIKKVRPLANGGGTVLLMSGKLLAGKIPAA